MFHGTSPWSGTAWPQGPATVHAINLGDGAGGAPLAVEAEIEALANAYSRNAALSMNAAP